MRMARKRGEWQGRGWSWRNGMRLPSRLKMVSGEDSWWWWCRCCDYLHWGRMARERVELQEVDETINDAAIKSISLSLPISLDHERKGAKESHGHAVHRNPRKEKKLHLLRICRSPAIYSSVGLLRSGGWALHWETSRQEFSWEYFDVRRATTIEIEDIRN